MPIERSRFGIIAQVCWRQKPTQRGADGGGDGSGTRFDAASEALAPCRQFPVSDKKLLAKVREQVVPGMMRRGPIEDRSLDH
jgi:hypothetical protein